LVGVIPGEDENPRELAANTRRLLSVEPEYDHRGIPRLSAVPVSLERCTETETAADRAGSATACEQALRLTY